MNQSKGKLKSGKRNTKALKTPPSRPRTIIKYKAGSAEGKICPLLKQNWRVEDKAKWTLYRVNFRMAYNLGHIELAQEYVRKIIKLEQKYKKEDK